VRAEKNAESTVSQSPQELLAAALAQALGQINPLPKTTGGIEFVGVEELARRLGLKPLTIRRLASRGDLPAGMLVGSVRRWDWLEVAGFLKARQGLRPRHRGRGRPPKQKTAAQPVEVSGPAGA
jgi:excisionase family DNA binding protein